MYKEKRSNSWRLKIISFFLVGIVLFCVVPLAAQEESEGTVSIEVTQADSSVPEGTVNIEVTQADSSASEGTVNIEVTQADSSASEESEGLDIWFGMPISITYQIPFEGNLLPIYLDSTVRELLMNIALNSSLNIGFQFMVRFTPEFSAGIESGVAISYYPFSLYRAEEEERRNEANLHCEGYCYSGSRVSYYRPVSVDSPLRLVAVFNVPDTVDIDVYGGLYFADLIKASRRIVFDIGARVGIPLGSGTLFAEASYVFPYSIALPKSRYNSYNSIGSSYSSYYQNALNVGLGYRIVL